MEVTLISLGITLLREGLTNVFGPPGRERRRKRRAARKARRAARKEVK